jgi:hypothetical protein
MVAEKLNLVIDDKNIFNNICYKLFDLEKYSTTKDKNKMIYLIVPKNDFPLNLEDRVDYIINNIQHKTGSAINAKINIISVEGRFNDINYVRYQILFDDTMDKFKDVMELHDATQKENKWIIIIE